MTAVPIYRVTIKCSGCETVLDAESATLFDARAVAHAQGWRFPQRVNSKGRPTAQIDDVCPECLPEWGTRLDHRTQAMINRIGRDPR